ncbi:DUF1510 family protein [Atopobacter sp. AH10]|uniref:DUF1510 family protein n=1 Tax=Atopobacter sp. AH10 TaxID=2315861 RepID=UPI000EF2520B|nr:DUF1510 family protein [Atopobacter sp. AH10]RLK63732.1 DUF1510 family protein [Atopobacter sp. AH10]
MKERPRLSLKIKKLLLYYRSYTLVFFSSLVIIFLFFIGHVLFGSKPIQDWINPKDTSEVVVPSQKEIKEKEKEKHQALVQQAKEKKKEEKKNLAKKVDSDDPNVLVAYEANWPYYKTEQKGDHWINFEEGSLDRQEIDAASRSVIKSKEQLTDYWLNVVDDKSIYLILTNEDNSKNYRVYMTFENEKGWRVTRYEELRQLTGEG